MKSKKTKHRVRSVWDLVHGAIEELREVIRKMTGNAVAFAMDCFKTRREEFEKFLVGSKLYHADLWPEIEKPERTKGFFPVFGMWIGMLGFR